MSKNNNSIRLFDSNNPLIFIHIPKTAGTTFHFILSREYKGQVSYWLPSNNAGSGEKILAKLPQERRLAIKLLRGHMYFGLDKYLSGFPGNIAFLRDPVSRVLSYYRHMKFEARVHDKDGDWWYEAARKSMPIVEYFELYRDKMIDNDQVRRISGVDFGYGECSEDHLEKARNNLRDRFEFVGITEQFDESIIAMKKYLSWRTKPFYLREKVSTRGDETVHDNDLLDEIGRRNHFDILLYEYAKELLRMKIEEYGPYFLKDLQGFQKQNHQMSRFLRIILPLYRRSRKLLGRRSFFVELNHE